MLAADPGTVPEALHRIRRYLPPLTHPLGDRIPILAWQGKGFPSGIANRTVEASQGTFIERGFLPLCNDCNSPSGARTYLPVLRYWQKRGVPVCILPQSWLQVPFVVDRKGTFRSAHEKPASQDHAFPCPARMTDARASSGHRAMIEETLTFLKDAGIHIRLLCIDFEAGAYLRNAGDREKNVEAQLREALKCPDCVSRFGREALATPAGYAAIVDRVRAECTRRILTEPLRNLFPEAKAGNYYAWPIARMPRPEGRWPAYGYTNSGLDVAMPRCYMNAGWGGAGGVQRKMNWNAFHSCLEAFSPAASVRRKGEWLIPWVHVWLGGRYLDFVTIKRRALPEPRALREMACHMMLRGAETFAVWMDTQIGEYPADYPYPRYAEMGQFVYDIKGIQEGFNEMLAFHAFLRKARPITFDVPGRRAELGPETATWSGMRTADKALVRTVVFGIGEPITKDIRLFGRTIRLTFGPQGRNYWVTPDGRVRPATTLRAQPRNDR